MKPEHVKSELFHDSHQILPICLDDYYLTNFEIIICVLAPEKKNVLRDFRKFYATQNS